MSTHTLDGKKLVQLVQGDITHQHVDAIVNAANSSLLGGGGVDGAIHRAAGPELLEECRKVRARSGSCPAGWAEATPAGKLHAKWVFHAVGPVYKNARTSSVVLVGAYRRCMRLAEEVGATSLAFPSISTGAYGYPIVEAAPLALGTVKEDLARSRVVKSVTFVLFSAADLRVYEDAWGALGR